MINKLKINKQINVWTVAVLGTAGTDALKLSQWLLCSINYLILFNLGFI